MLSKQVWGKNRSAADQTRCPRRGGPVADRLIHTSRCDGYLEAIAPETLSAHTSRPPPQVCLELKSCRFDTQFRLSQPAYPRTLRRHLTDSRKCCHTHSSPN